MSDIVWGIIRAIIGIAIIVAMFWFDKNKFESVKKKNGKMSKPFHKRWWTWAIVAVLIIGGIGGVFNSNSDDDQTASSETANKKQHTHKKSKSEKEFEKKMDKLAEKQSKEEAKKHHKDNGFVPSKKTKKEVEKQDNLAKDVRKEHLAALKKKLNSLNADKYNGNAIDKIDVQSPDHIEVTFSKHFIKTNTKDERVLLTKSIVDDIGDIYDRYEPYPDNTSIADIVFFDTEGNGYGIWNTDGEKED